MDLARNLIGRINVGDTLTRAAAARPGQLAVVDGGRRFSYADFNGYVNRVAHGLASEYGLMPYWGLARLLRIAPVNREMILNSVAQHSLGLPRSY